MIFIKEIKRKKSDFQFYMHQFVESAVKLGFPSVPEHARMSRFKIRALLWRILKKFPFFIPSNLSNCMIVPSGGSCLLSDSIPYCFSYKIIPMLWDCWPEYWKSLFKSLEILKCEICFVTSSQMVDVMRQRFPNMKVYWIPEGIDISDYNKGERLEDREYCLYELGRQHKEYHRVVMNLYKEDTIPTYYGNKYVENLTTTLPKIKIVVSFPRCDTHPQKKLETLTQRYWESMLCRNLIVGRSPKELIDLIGYNPVINVDWNNPELQLRTIIGNISDYQYLVDKNYATALQYASWDNRIENILKQLCLK